MSLTINSQEIIDQYFNDTVFNGILALSTEDKSNVFTMFTTHADVLTKILPAGSHPLIDHIKGTPWVTANNIVANNSTITINYDQAQPLLTAYDEWKANTAT